MLPYSPMLTTTMRTLQTFFYILTFLLGLFLNSLVIALVASNKTLRTRSTMISLQVMLLNLVVLLLVLSRPSPIAGCSARPCAS